MLYLSVLQVYKRVHITGEEQDSVIGFYNRVFMHNMKTYVLQFATRQVSVSGHSKG